MYRSLPRACAPSVLSRCEASFSGRRFRLRSLSLAACWQPPLKRVRGTQKALAEFGSLFEAGSREAPSLHVGIAHAAAPARMAALEQIVAAARPQATLDIATTLGAVVGTHAGPGTIGFFWFDDRE